MERPNDLRVLVCGGRNYTDYEYLKNVILDYSIFNNPIACIIHGAARGADLLADKVAKTFDIPVVAFPADWNKYGKSAGYIRNKQMLDEGKPDLVIAFPGGRGTAMMVKIAKEAGVEVIEIGKET